MEKGELAEEGGSKNQNDSMALKIASLNSGSNGNCYYVGTEAGAVLVDAGLSCRETERRMRERELSMDSVKALVISHEHGDHVRGVIQLSKRHQLPVYISELTRRHARLLLYPHLARHFESGKAFMVEDLEIFPFKKFHDAADPHSFLIRRQGVCVGVFTDLGRVCDSLIEGFSVCHAAFLETNFEPQVLEEGPYPPFLKDRIRGGWGHLSNPEAARLVREHRSPHLSRLVLTHLSAKNNRPDLALSHFDFLGDDVEVFVASRYEASPVWEVTGELVGDHEKRTVSP